MTPAEIINELIYKYASLREFARAIREDGSDVMRWRHGKSKVTPRAVIKICELHSEFTPHELNPDIFPAHLKLIFEDSPAHALGRKMDKIVRNAIQEKGK